MYKVIIVDDEEIMREGLISLVDWSALGFEVCAQFEDGEEAINYLEDHQADVILTDIKMTFVSGIDLARFISEQKLHIKIVFISGYKDFDYAMQAVNYNVVKYLLKPISLKEINNVFDGIRAELDSEREVLQFRNDRKKKYNELLSYIRDQFFMDLVLGALQDPVEIQKRLNVLELDLDSINYPCCIWNIVVDNYECFLLKNWDYGMESFHKAIYNIICSNKDNFLFYTISRHDNSFKIFIIAPDKLSCEDFRESVETHIRYAGNNAKKLLGLELSNESRQYFASLNDLSYKISMLNTEPNSLKSNIREHLNDQQKLLMTHILNRNQESAYSLANQILKQINVFGLGESQILLTELLTRIVQQFRNNNISVPEELHKDTIQRDVSLFKSGREISDYLITLLDQYFQMSENDEEQSDGVTIQHIKEYINENYNHDITLENIADYVFLSPVYISRLFKNKTGENFSDYLIRIRMEYALEYLTDPQYKVYQVGHKIGYKSTKYFYRLFKQFYGCTPSEYRRKSTRKEVNDIEKDA